MALVIFDEENCKGCQLCASACPQKIVSVADGFNSKGFHPAMIREQERCTGCALCATMCPDLAIEVFK